MNHTDDADLVTATLSGNREAFAAIYDRFADQLYSTAASMLSDRDEAADVVQDVFVTAATRLGQLRDPSRLRAWLFAILRNEVYRRSRQRRRAVPTDFTEPGHDVAAPDTTEALADDLAGAELAELVQQAARGLDERDQLVLELSVRQGLQGADLADALGVSAQQSYGLVHRMRERAERSLTAYCVARAGRRDCTELNAVLASWDGEFGVLIRKRVARHIDRCDTCERSKRRLAPVPVFGAAPVLAAPIALRDRVLGAIDTAVGHDAWGDARGDAADTGRWSRREADRDGFPRRVRRAGGRAGMPAAVPVAVAALVLLVVVALVFTLSTGGDDPLLTGTDTAEVDGASAPDADSASDALDGADPADDPDATLAETVDGDDPASTGPSGTSESGLDSSGVDLIDGGPNEVPPAPTQPPTATTAPAVAPTPTQPPANQPAPTEPPVDAPAPTTAPPTTAAPTTTTAPTTAPPAPGAIVATVSSVDFGLTDTQRTFGLSNPGGTAVNFSVSTPAGFGASPTTGQIAPGQTVTITVTISRAGLTEGPVAAAASVTSPGLGTQQVTLSADVRRPPVISGVNAPTAPVCLGTVPTSVTISATITDESSFAAVLSWSGPSGQSGQVNMSGSPMSGTFAIDGSPPTVGGWSWTITATDTWGASASNSGTFTTITCP